MGNVLEVDTNKLNLMELFTSVQGEGMQAGTLTTFIRFGGCNRSCNWCDEPESIPLKRPTHEAKTPLQIMSMIPRNASGVICLTGGEPLIQDRMLLETLCQYLIKDGYSISVETNGTRVVESLFPYIDLWTVSPKLGSSGNQEQIQVLTKNVARIASQAKQMQLKFVVSNIDDVLEMKTYVDMFPQITTFVNSMWDEVKFEPKHTMQQIQTLLERADVNYRTRTNFKLGIQYHKVWNLR